MAHIAELTTAVAAVYDEGLNKPAASCCERRGRAHLESVAHLILGFASLVEANLDNRAGLVELVTHMREGCVGISTATGCEDAKLVDLVHPAPPVPAPAPEPAPAPAPAPEPAPEPAPAPEPTP